MDKISIITATFNSENTIIDNLETVKNQTHQNIEHIIVDGQSTDSTLEICKRYNHISKVISEKDNGIYDAFNKGIYISTGSIIGFLNSDDYFSSNEAVNIISNVFKKNEDIQIIYGNINYVREKNKKIFRKWISGEYKKNNFLIGWSPPHPTFYVRREIYKKYGDYDLNYGNPSDFELMYRFIELHKLKTQYINEILVLMREGGVSNKSILNIIKQNFTIIKLLKEKNPNFKLIKFILNKIIYKSKEYIR